MRVESCLDSWETVGNRVYRSAIGYFRGHGQSTWLFPSVGTPQRSAQLIPFADSINRLIFHGCHGCSPRVGQIHASCLRESFEETEEDSCLVLV